MGAVLKHLFVDRSITIAGDVRIFYRWVSGMIQLKKIIEELEHKLNEKNRRGHESS